MLLKIIVDKKTPLCYSKIIRGGELTLETDNKYFKQVESFARILEDKREALKDLDGESWSYRGLAKHMGINHRHLARVLKPKDFYTFQTLLDVIYPLGFTIALQDPTFKINEENISDVETFKTEVIQAITSYVRQRQETYLGNGIKMSQRKLGELSNLAHTQAKGVIQGSKNYNIQTLMKVLEVFDQTIQIKPRQ